MSKYLVIAGHGKQQNGKMKSGATGYIYQGEHVFIANKFFDSMKKYANDDFIFFSEYDVFDKGDIVSLAHRYGRDTKVIEVHFDSHTNKTASGGHVIIWHNYRPDKMDLRIRDAIKKVMGLNKAYNHRGHEGISGRNLQNARLCSRANINYRLIELGFGTNKRDSEILLNETDKYAKELVLAISGEVKEQSKTPNKKPTKKTYKGNSIVDYLKLNKIDSSFSNRKKLAQSHGIRNYRGTAKQNLELLRKLQKPAKKTYKGNSIVDYLKLNKIDSSFSNRKKLAQSHGIRNYRGTAKQNLELLRKLQK